MRFSLIVLCCLAYTISLGGPEIASLAPGTWTGELTQQPGAISQSYRFRIDLSMTPTNSPTRMVEMPLSKLLGWEELTATIRNGGLDFAESTVIFQDRPPNGWCIKTGQLQLSQTNAEFVLQGPLEGQSRYRRLSARPDPSFQSTQPRGISVMSHECGRTGTELQVEGRHKRVGLRPATLAYHSKVGRGV